MSTPLERPPDDAADATVAALLVSGGLAASATVETTIDAATEIAATAATEIATTAATLGTLPLGAHLVLRCRKDWRTATVVRIELEKITLSISSPNGRTYRLRRPPDAPLDFDGHVPLLGAGGHWRTALARYDTRW